MGSKRSGSPTATNSRCACLLSTTPAPFIDRRDDHWHDGELRAWRRDLDGWRGFVCYAEFAGLRWLEWVSAEGVRLA
jgi:hypothetical protein